MKTSEEFIELTKALVKAQSEMGSAKKDSNNPHFRSSYADLNSVLDACKEILNKNNITVLQPHVTEQLGDQTVNFVETVLIHESGQFISSQTPVVVKDASNPQSLMSGITYARRYGLQSLICLPAEDDDGEGAIGRTAAPVKKFEKPTSAPKADKKGVPSGKAGTGFRRGKKPATDDDL